MIKRINLIKIYNIRFINYAYFMVQNLNQMGIIKGCIPFLHRNQFEIPFVSFRVRVKQKEFLTNCNFGIHPHEIIFLITTDKELQHS
jgi:hypothetical protein